MTRKEKIAILDQYFEKHEEGWIAYKVFNFFNFAPPEWAFPKPGQVLKDRVALDRSDADCGAGINVGTAQFVEMVIRNVGTPSPCSCDWMYDDDGNILDVADELINNWDSEEADLNVYAVLLKKSNIDRIIIPTGFRGKCRTNTVTVVGAVSPTYKFHSWSYANVNEVDRLPRDYVFL